MATKGGLVILSEMYTSLSASEKKVASYLLEHPQEAILLTANELGNRSSTSGATVIRLCKSLHLKGFQDLKLRIAGDLNKTSESGYRDIEPNESISSIIEKMVSNSMQTIQETAELLDTAELQKAINVLEKVDRVHFVGVGASSIIAQDAQQKFIRINKTAYAFSDMHMAATLIANGDSNDAVVGISFSGETPEVANILNLARKKHIHTLSLTKYSSSTATREADINLYTSATREPTFRSGATSSRMAQLQVIDILFMCVASLQYDKTVKYLDTTREAVKNLVQKNNKK
ncbi:MAG TPA: MurR/RpiR family transcriptional regulator [Virgibacillus sp.]|nr:MurR/RpiR family transcriptional regulator [Virgibacillus sp.]HLR68417.1 MurR/RpiR family transcriptional regulator [Virgibacillus sp.]